VYLIAIICTLIELWRDFWDRREGKLDEGYILKTFKARESLKNINNGISLGESSYKTALITGGDGNIGKELSNLLLKLNFKVCSIGLHNSINSKNLFFFETDLSDEEQLKNTVRNVKREFSNGFDLVFLNAGVMLHPYKICKEHELHFKVNLLSQVFLINNLRSILNIKENRILFISSTTSRAGFFNENDINKEFWKRYLNGYKSYADSKMLVNIFVDQVDKELFPKSIFISNHPGIIPGPLYRHTNGLFRFAINHVLKYIARDSHTGALKLLELVSRDDLRSGAYYEDGVDASYVTESVSIKLRKKLYDKIMKEVEAY